MATTPTEYAPTTRSFKKLFAEQMPKDEKILRATGYLFDLNNLKLNPIQLELWLEILEPFGEGELAAAFLTVATTGDGFLKPAMLTRPILDQEFTEDFAWLMRHLDVHGVMWRDRQPVYKPRKRIPGGTPEDFYPLEEETPAIPAPAMPERLQWALAAYGAGSMLRGLEFLFKHPACERVDYEASEAIRVKGQIEREFRAAWNHARQRELAG